MASDTNNKPIPFVISVRTDNKISIVFSSSLFYYHPKQILYKHLLQIKCSKLICNIRHFAIGNNVNTHQI